MNVRATIEFDDLNSTIFSLERANGLLSVNISTTATNGSADIFYGLISNYGSIEFIDSNFDFYVFINRSDFTSFTVKIYNDNSVIGTFYGSRDVSYNIYTKTVSINFKGVLEKMQDKKINIKYDSNVTNGTAYTVYEMLVEKSVGFEFVLDSETEEFLKSISIEYIYLAEDTLWNQWQKLCQIAQLRIYMNTDGKVVVKRYV